MKTDERKTLGWLTEELRQVLDLLDKLDIAVKDCEQRKAFTDLTLHWTAQHFLLRYAENLDKRADAAELLLARKKMVRSPKIIDFAAARMERAGVNVKNRRQVVL